MKKILSIIFVVLFFFISSKYSFSEERIGPQLGLNIKKTDIENVTEIILFKKETEIIQSLAKKLTGANSVSTDSMEYLLLQSSKEERSLKLKIMRYSFLRLEYSW